MRIYQDWRQDLYARAKLTSFMQPAEEEENLLEKAEAAKEAADQAIDTIEGTIDIPEEELPAKETTQEETLL